MAAMILSPLDRQQRIDEFSTKWQLSRLRTVEKKPLNISFKVQGDEEAADTALQTIHSARLETAPRKGLTRLLTTKRKPSQYKSREISAALSNVVESNASTGTVEVLLQRLLAANGNPNLSEKSTSTWKRWKGIDQDEKRMDVLSAATKLGSYNTVRLLAPHADQLSLDQALAEALRTTSNRLQLDVVELLLAHGADANLQAEQFMIAIASNRLDLVSLILSAPKSVSAQCMTEGLLCAIQSGSLEMSFRLALSDADGNDDNGHILKTAVQAARSDLVTVMTLCKYPPSIKTLDEALPIAFINESTSAYQKKLLISILLHAGANGVGAAWSLRYVTNFCINSDPKGEDFESIEALDLLLQFNASLNYQDQAALKQIVSSGRTDLLDRVLTANHFDEKLATIGFASISSTADRALQGSIASRLLDRGASGAPVHEALIAATASNHMEAVTLLVTGNRPNKASVDYHDAKALKDAVSRGEIELVKVLLSGNPNVQSLSGAFTCIWKCSREKRLVLAEDLLNHGARGSHIDGSLIHAVADLQNNRDLDLIRLLVRGADVNTENGKAMAIATQVFDMEVLDALLQSAPRPESLNPAFDVAMALESNFRLVACRKLLKAGATGARVDKALATALIEKADDLTFFKLILSYSDIDYENGLVVRLAVTHCLPRQLSLILAQGPKRPTFDNAFTAAMAHRESENQLKYTRILLEAPAPRKSASKAMYNASADYDEGAAMKAAVNIQSIEILHSIISKTKQPLAKPTLEAGFRASLAVTSEQKRLQILKIILEAGLKGTVIDDELISQSAKGDEGLAICSLLLEFGASIDRRDGEALDNATKSGSIKLLDVMLQRPKISPISSTALSKSFRSAMRLDSKERLSALKLLFKAGLPKDHQVDDAVITLVDRDSNDIASLKALLEFGASIHHRENKPVISAASKSNNTILMLLLEYIQDQSAVSIAFEFISHISGFWKTKNGCDTMRILLSHGASGPAVNETLVSVLESTEEPLAPSFFDTLLNWNADVNYGFGLPLQTAARKADLQALVKLIAHGASPKSILMAFPYIFSAGAGEDKLLAIMNLFSQHAGTNLGSGFQHRAVPDAIVFLSIRHYPRSTKILNAILDLGFNVDDKMYHRLGDEYGEGNVTALFWALCLAKGEVDESVMELLIQRGACEAGDIASMEALLSAKPETNDGTLHDAARLLNHKAIGLLIAYGHNPNRPSARHEGRSPLAELCYRSSSSINWSHDGDVEQQMRKSIKALIAGGAKTNIQTRTHGASARSLLLLALDSSSPEMMTRAFLESDQCDYINHDFNLYYHNGYTYSPLMYVEKGVWEGRDDQREATLNILRTFQAVPRYWKDEGEQPPDMVGAPEDIRAADRKHKEILAEKQRRQQELEERLLLREREAQAAIDLKVKEAAIERRLAEERHQSERNALNARLEADIRYHETKVNLENKRETQQRNHEAAKAAIELKKLKEIEGVKRQGRDHEMKLLQEERMLVDSRTALGQKTIEVAKAQMEYGQWTRNQIAGTTSRPAIEYNLT
ncbi:hypothetical protein B0O99DRAFT_594245 [Bisporella sp. PMI_857]|nr:hypothetical protein B0O99DRAFT_594245 [Bisporella sp. PMI_857]